MVRWKWPDGTQAFARQNLREVFRDFDAYIQKGIPRDLYTLLRGTWPHREERRPRLISAQNALPHRLARNNSGNPTL